MKRYEFDSGDDSLLILLLLLLILLLLLLFEGDGWECDCDGNWAWGWWILNVEYSVGSGFGDDLAKFDGDPKWWEFLKGVDDLSRSLEFSFDIIEAGISNLGKFDPEVIPVSSNFRFPRLDWKPNTFGSCWAFCWVKEGNLFWISFLSPFLIQIIYMIINKGN